MRKPIWWHILFSTITVIVVGFIVFRLMPGNWMALIQDVDEFGAWIVLLIYHLVYSFFIIIGILLSIHIIRCSDGIPKLYFSLVSSGGTMVLWYTIDFLHYFRNVVFFILGFYFSVSSFVLNILLFLIDKKITRRLQVDAKKDARR